jgi:hypothetical protein
VPGEEGALEVLVLEPGGAPAPGAIVTASRAGDPRIALAATAGEDGRAVLPAGPALAFRGITLRARSGGRAGEWTGALPSAGAAVVRLRPGAAVAGAVRGGRPVSGFTLEVAAQPAPDGWRTLDAHRFAGDRFELSDLPVGPVRLTVRTDDGRRGAAELRLAPGETSRVDVSLDR